MKEIRIRNPQAEAKALLDMDTKQASLQFQQYTTEEQLVVHTQMLSIRAKLKPISFILEEKLTLMTPTPIASSRLLSTVLMNAQKVHPDMCVHALT